MGDNADLRLAFLKKLVAISRSLDSDKEETWRELAAPIVTGFKEYQLRILEQRRMFTKILNGNRDPDTETECNLLYKLLDLSTP